MISCENLKKIVMSTPRQRRGLGSNQQRPQFSMYVLTVLTDGIVAGQPMCTGDKYGSVERVEHCITCELRPQSMQPWLGLFWKRD